MKLAIVDIFEVSPAFSSYILCGILVKVAIVNVMFIVFFAVNTMRTGCSGLAM